MLSSPTGRKVATAAVVVAALIVAFLVWNGRPRGTAGHLESWLKGHCASVDHQRLPAPQGTSLPRQGVTSDDQLVCNMLSGQVDVLQFSSQAARNAAIAKSTAGLDGACLVKSDQLVVDNLLGGGHQRDFREWCKRLDGRQNVR